MAVETGRDRSRINVIVRFSALGDVVLTSGFLQKLADERPNEEIIYVSSGRFKDLLTKYFPHPIHFLPLQKRRWGLLGYFLRGKAAAQQVSSLLPKEIHIFDLHNVPKSRLWVWGFRFACYLKGIPLRQACVEKRRWERWKLVNFKERQNKPYHVYKRDQALLAGPKLFYPKLKVKSVRPEHLKILLALDAQHWKKVWPAENWAELIRMLDESNLRTVHITLVGNASKLSEKLAGHTAKILQITNLIGKTDLVELPQIAAEHHLAVCGNTAWQHICESVETPVVSLLGPLDPEFGFSPFLPNSRELSVDIDCRPCTLHGSGKCVQTEERYHACMREIKPSDVYSSLLIMGARQV